MFKEAHFIYTSGYYRDNQSNLDKVDNLIKIHDDDFVEQIKITRFEIGMPYELMSLYALACIKIYEKKNLDVVSNLTLLILKEHEPFKVEQIIRTLDHSVPEFKKYKPEVEKILLFS